MFASISCSYVFSDTFSFRRRHYWTEAPKWLKHLRTPHEHNFQLTMGIQVRGENREIACEILNECIDFEVQTLEFTLPWSCETMAKKLIERIGTRIKEVHKIDVVGRGFFIEVSEGVDEQGCSISGTFQE